MVKSATIEKEQEVSFTQKYPEVLRDTSLFKVILTPLELYVLKLFIRDLNPRTIRDIQLYTIRLIFDGVFFKSAKMEDADLIEQLLKEGYGSQNLSHKNIKSAIKDTTTIEAEIKDKFSLLKKHKVKCPSYEMLQASIENLEKAFILTHRRRDEVSKFYLINPNFYIHFKDKLNEIKNL